MALSQKLTQKLRKYVVVLPNTLYAHADCKESGKILPFCHWQGSTAGCNKLSVEQQKVIISWASIYTSLTNAEVCVMSCRAEHMHACRVRQLLSEQHCYCQCDLLVKQCPCSFQDTELNLELTLSHALASDAMYLCVRWYRAEDVAPGP